MTIVEGFSAAELQRIPACHVIRLLPPEQRAAAVELWFNEVVARRMPPRVETQADLHVMYHWQRLAFDTEQLGLEAARIDYLMTSTDVDEGATSLLRWEALHHILREVQAMVVRHLSCRLDAADVATMHLLEENEFRLVDGLLTFARPLTEPLATPHLPFRLAQADDVAALRQLGLHGFRHDRFHADHAVESHRADRLHAQWLENAVGGSAADFVLVHEAAGEIRGVVTVGIDNVAGQYVGGPVGTIGLIVTEPRHQGQGIGTALTCAVLAELVRRGARWCQIGTQLRNIEASRVYEAGGFRLIASSITMRRLFE